MNDNKQLQIEYYQFMHKEGFVKGNAPNPAKDARQKTSGLVDIGLIDSERNLTEVGRVLLSIAQNSDFKSDNPLQIPKDSFIYLKQLLKMSDNIDGNVVRPFVVAAYVVSKLDYLSNDEFTYLLPLCINKEKTNSIINDIFAVRNKSKSIDDVIIDTLMSMDNYKSALQFFQSSEVTEDVIGKIGINRKSGSGGVQNYDKPYFKFYTLLHDVVLNKNAESVLPLLEQSSKINGKAATLWRKALFQTTARTKVQQEKLRVLTDVPIFNVGSESEFKQLFFEMLHLYKAKATLTDYFDLNRRYCKTTDTLLFADGKVEFDVIPACWIKNISEQLPQIAFAPIDTLAADTELSEIASFLEIDTNKLYSDLERLFGIHITSGEYASDGNNVFVNAIVYSPNSSQYISEDCKRKITKTIGYNSERIQIFTTNMLPTIRACIVYDDKQKPLWCSLQSYQYEYDKLPLTELSVQSDLFTFVVDNKDDYKDYKDSKDTLKAITDTIEAEFTRLKG